LWLAALPIMLVVKVLYNQASKDRERKKLAEAWDSE